MPRAQRLVYFASLLLAALALVPSGAHLAELPHKLALAANDYLTVQQIYRGWSLFGIVVFGALISTGTLTALVWRRGGDFWMPLLAFLSIAGTQIVFWLYTYPVNRVTENWTLLPPDWIGLRNQWEFSHAASAVFNLIAVVALLFSLLQQTRR